MIGSFDVLEWFDTMTTIFSMLIVILLVASAVIFFYTKHLIHKWHGEHKSHGHAGHRTDAAHEPEHIPAPEAEITAGRAEEQQPAVELQAEWNRIKANAESIRESEWKLSIIEADKLVDDVLKQMGFPGESMGERLMMIKLDELTSLQDLWDAHKLRNLIVHDTSYHITHEQVLSAMRSLERVLRELGQL